MSYPNQVFTSFAFLGFLLCAIPLPWHLEAWNTGTCLFMIWSGLSCLNQFINSIVWRDNAINWAPVWCDISTKFIIGSSVAIPAASLCINRRLYHIATVRTVTVSSQEKRRAVLVDLAIGLGLPVVEMVLHYIAQGHRFNILEEIGCWPHTYNTWVAYVLVFTPPILIGLVSAFYATRSLLAFNAHRAKFQQLMSKHSNLNSSRYFRLMSIAGIELVCTVPIGCYFLFLNYKGNELHPWISWEDTHWRFSRVDNVPASIWRADKTVAFTLEFSRWLCVICAVIFFAFFGFADEAKRNYRSAVQSISKRVGINTTGGTFFKFASGGTGGSSGATNTTGKSGWFSSVSDGGFMSSRSDDRKIRQVTSIPVLVKKEVVSRRDSLDSLGMSHSPGDVGVLGSLTEEKPSDLESQFIPTLSYASGFTLSDVAGTLSIPSSAPSSPSPSLTRENSYRNTTANAETSVLTLPAKAHTADVV